MQDEVRDKSVALAIKVGKSGGKLTADLLKWAMRRYLDRSRNPIHHGKQSVKQLVRQGAGVQNIEITDQNIKSFERVARKYGVDFALKKDSSKDPPTYIVFFKAKDLDMINLAFNDYSERKLRDKPSIRKALSKMKELAKTINPKDRARRKEQERDR